jgi:aerobic-type carbon monoxide dehydrogenase small subunit (CoxS/CutS family)
MTALASRSIALWMSSTKSIMLIIDFIMGCLMSRITELNVNGAKRRVDVEPDRSLLSVLREDLELTGSKYGCGEGQCGSCITAIGSVSGKPITTIEGLENNGRLNPLQQAFLEADALQCGYCTSGMIMSGVALLNKNPNPGDEEIVRFMDGNICRCGAYPRIVAAITRAARIMKGGAR